MARLKCLNCGSVFDKRALVAYAGVGPTYAGVGLGWGPIVWPILTNEQKLHVRLIIEDCFTNLIFGVG
ncbi:MAG: hypothetical protein ABSC91_00645 [Candidatus Bathyarchaeia archaeon]